MSLLVLGLIGLVSGDGGSSLTLSIDGAGFLGASALAATADGEAAHKEADGQGELLELSEGGFTGEVGDVKVKCLLNEVDKSDDRSEASAEEQGNGNEGELGPGDALDDDLAVLVDLAMSEDLGEEEAGAGMDGGFEVFIVGLEGGGVLFVVLEGVPGDQGEESEEDDSEGEAANCHYGL